MSVDSSSHCNADGSLAQQACILWPLQRPAAKWSGTTEPAWVSSCLAPWKGADSIANIVQWNSWPSCSPLGSASGATIFRHLSVQAFSTLFSFASFQRKCTLHAYLRLFWSSLFLRQWRPATRNYHLIWPRLSLRILQGLPTAVWESIISTAVKWSVFQ